MVKRTGSQTEKNSSNVVNKALFAGSFSPIDFDITVVCREYFFEKVLSASNELKGNRSSTAKILFISKEQDPVTFLFLFCYLVSNYKNKSN